MQWFRLADRLGVPLQELQRKTTSTEFVEWQRYLEIEMNTPSKTDHYLAQIACEVRRTITKKRIKNSDFHLKFQKDQPVEKRMKSSKSFWGALLQGPGK